MESRRDERRERREITEAAMPVGHLVTPLLDWFRANIGGGSVLLEWDRSGLQSITVLGHGDPWTAEDIYGRLGSVRLTATGSILPINEVDLDYNRMPTGYRVRATAMVDESLLSIREVGPMGAAPVGLDPGTLLTILSIIWSLAHPRIELRLPGEVRATVTMEGDEIVVNFTKSPSVVITALFTAEMQIDRATLSATKATLHLLGHGLLGWFSKTKQYDIE